MIEEEATFDFFLVINSGGWNTHRILGGGISAFPSCFLVYLENQDGKKIIGHFLGLDQSLP